MLTAEQAAERLGVSMRTIRSLLYAKVLEGNQIPWQIPAEALTTRAVVGRVQSIKDGVRFKEQTCDTSTLLLLPRF